MTARRRLRSLAGFAAVITLLGLIAADTIHPGISLSFQDKAILISLISALLGVDIALQQLPIEIAPNRTTSKSDDGDQGDE
jgi:hypothetical protein